MKIRIKFAKSGNMRFIGHLDIMRYFQKAMRRAGIPVRYSEGFSPHQIMSFAAPLSIGVEGFGEYMDIELKEGSYLSSAEAVNMLNSAMCEGMSILSFNKLPDGSKTAMSIVDSADYEAVFNESIPYEIRETAVREILSSEEIMVEKQSKESVKLVNIRPMINELRAVKENNSIFMNISQGSVNNLKPELIFKAMNSCEPIADYLDKGYRLKRLELYAQEHMRLDEYGEELI